MLTVIRFILALFSLIASTVALGVSYSTPATPQATLAEIYYGYVADSSSSVYLSGQTVTFSLKNNTHTPLSPPLTWIIIDSTGRVVRQSSLSSTSPYFFTGNWNQKNGDGRQVAPGVYTLIFPETPNKAATVFTVLPGKKNPLAPEDKQAGELPVNAT